MITGVNIQGQHKALTTTSRLKKVEKIKKIEKTKNIFPSDILTSKTELLLQRIISQLTLGEFYARQN